jgi:hypothetical protein
MKHKHGVSRDEIYHKHSILQFAMPEADWLLACYKLPSSASQQSS